jgi:hypothetical protein
VPWYVAEVDERAEASEAARELGRAIGLHRGKYPDEAWGLLRGTYMEAVRVGLATKQIEAITGMSIADLEEIVGEP